MSFIAYRINVKTEYTENSTSLYISYVLKYVGFLSVIYLLQVQLYVWIVIGHKISS